MRWRFESISIVLSKPGLTPALWNADVLILMSYLTSFIKPSKLILLGLSMGMPSARSQTS